MKFSQRREEEEHSLARWQLLFAISTVKQALRIIADLVAHAIHEHVPAVDRRGTVAPRIDAERTIVAVEIAGIPIALLVAVMIAGFLAAAIFDALLALTFQVKVIGIRDFGYVNVRSAEYAATIILVIDLAVLAGPLGRAVTRVIADQILANCIWLLARVARAFVPSVDLAVLAGSARWTVTQVAAVVIGDAARTAVHARRSVAIGAGKFTVATVKVARA